MPTHLFERLNLLTHQVSLFTIVAALGVVFWGFRPELRAPAPRVDETPPRHQILIDVRAQRLALYRGKQLLGVFPCATQVDAQGRITALPAGKFKIHHQRDDEVYGRVFALSYPSVELARRALRAGWIDRDELIAIEEAHRFELLPPQDTRLGPSPLIVGGGRGRPHGGAIALDDEDLEQLAPFLQPGTPVYLR